MGTKIRIKLTLVCVAAIASSGGFAQIKQPSVLPAPLIGRATVVDGDTISILGERIRLNGVDAPEAKQSCKDETGQPYRCGLLAAKALDDFLARSRPTRCVFVERDRYGRYVGNCFRADGLSVSQWLVFSGNAIDFVRHSGGANAPFEADARTNKRGVWQGEFEAPWQWRADRAVAQSTKSPSPPVTSSSAPQVQTAPFGMMGSSCKIKGNVSSKGERVYHVPGQRDYARTRISTRIGERWFCSEAEARQAGWRRARR
jgi:endonuclease YncB( thermonuclease family)